MLFPYNFTLKSFFFITHPTWADKIISINHYILCMLYKLSCFWPTCTVSWILMGWLVIADWVKCNVSVLQCESWKMVQLKKNGPVPYFIFLQFDLCLNIRIHNDINITVDNRGLLYFSMSHVCFLTEEGHLNCTECPASVFQTRPWHIF